MSRWQRHHQIIGRVVIALVAIALLGAGLFQVRVAQMFGFLLGW